MADDADIWFRRVRPPMARDARAKPPMPISTRFLIRLAAASLAAALALGATPSLAEGVALTFDDLPQLSLTDSTAYARITNLRLLGGLRRHRFPAVGFVIGGRLDNDHDARAALLSAWLRDGLELGNHTYDHEALNETPLPQYLASIARTDQVLRPILRAHHQKPIWFRHPYLETGPTEAVRASVANWLKDHGYRMAPVTLENSDWMFAQPYDEAVLKGDKAEARHIRKAYVDYTARVVPWYRRAAFQLFGRRPPLIFLLHASRINADSVDDFARILRRNHLHTITLERAMADRAYATPDGMADRDGDEWLSRWSEVLHKDLGWDSFPKPPPEIAAADKRLDSEP